VLREAISHRGLPVSTAEELLGIGPEQRPIVVERALAERWDQTMAREAVTRADAAKGKLAGVVQDRSAEAMGASRRALTKPVDVSERRPPGFTRAVCEFHRMVMAVRIDDLSRAGRAALRALFRDLVMVARASANRRQPVFPPLPGTQSSRSTRPASSGMTRRRSR
jgi:hypothetical protein